MPTFRNAFVRCLRNIYRAEGSEGLRNVRDCETDGGIVGLASC